MNMKMTLRLTLLGTTAMFLSLAGLSGDPQSGLQLLPDAQAVVGAPMTPVSAAGVARRTTRRVVAAESAGDQQQAAATAQQQQAVAQQQAATAQQQAATAQQQAVVAQQQAGAKPAAGTVSTVLPPGCKPLTKDGVEYQKCGEVYYRAAFQGNNLVYVVQQP